MWYLAWVLGVSAAVLLAIVNAVYGENHELREEEAQQQNKE